MILTIEVGEKMEKKKIFKIGVMIFLIIMVVLGVSYAYIRLTLTGSRKQVIRAGNLQLELSEDVNNLMIDNAMPMYDEVGIIQEKEFTFQLINKADVVMSYVLKLEETESSIQNENRLDTGIVKYGLIKDGNSSINFLSTMEEKDGKIDEGTIDGDTTIHYRLKFWIDSNVKENHKINQKSLSYKIKIEGTQKVVENKVMFTYKDKVYDKIIGSEKTTFPNLNLEEDETAKIIGCNNEALPSYEEGTMSVQNITGDTTCTIYSSLQEASTQMDSSYNNIVLIKDENYVDEIISFTDKNSTIDLNGHVIKFTPESNNLTTAIIRFLNDSNIILQSSKNKGGIILNLDNTTKKRALIEVKENANLTVLSGYYSSNTNEFDCSTIEKAGTSEKQGIVTIRGKKADYCTSDYNDYNTGLCIYNGTSASLKNNGASNGIINIYGGSLVSENYAYMTDAPGGVTNIYDGYFKGANYSILTKSNLRSTIINICGGEFDSPTDISSGGDNIQIYYKSNLNWKNGSTPSLAGDYQQNVHLKEDLVCQ